MPLAEKCEAELRQDRCPHVLEPIAQEDRRDLPRYKYHCVKCGKYLKVLNGVLKATGAVTETK